MTKGTPRDAPTTEETSSQTGGDLLSVHLPAQRALGRNRGRTPARIACARVRRPPSSIDRHAHEDGPHLMELEGVTRKLRADQGFTHGGRRHQEEEGLRPWWLSR